MNEFVFACAKYGGRLSHMVSCTANEFNIRLRVS